MQHTHVSRHCIESQLLPSAVSFPFSQASQGETTDSIIFVPVVLGCRRHACPKHLSCRTCGGGVLVRGRGAGGRGGRRVPGVRRRAPLQALRGVRYLTLFFRFRFSSEKSERQGAPTTQIVCSCSMDRHRMQRSHLTIQSYQCSSWMYILSPFGYFLVRFLAHPHPGFATGQILDLPP
jgi:hypothetical protein